MISIKCLYPVAVAATMLLGGCRKEDVIPLPDATPVAPAEPSGEVKGFYLLNEGNMGSNKSTLDYFDAAAGTYFRNIYSAANPDVPKELGDVGNDLAIYGDRLYAVINCSNKVEVMDALTAHRIGKVDIPNCRSVAFDGPYAYVTSYAGPVEISPDYRQKGYVARIDTATLAVTATVTVGYQPDGIAISGGKAYVANSGGYMVPRYERTVSVVNLATMEVERAIDVAVNLNHVIADRHGCLWISSRGDYYDTASRLFCYDIASDAIVAEFDVAVGSMWLDGDSLYIVGTRFSYLTASSAHNYIVIDTASRTVVSENFITDGSESQIREPYSVAVNPVTGEIYVGDAINHVNPGNLYCFSPEGTLRWTERTGDIPAHFAFLRR